MMLGVFPDEVLDRASQFMGQEEADALKQAFYNPEWVAEHPNAEIDLTGKKLISDLPNFTTQQRANWVEGAKILYESKLGKSNKEAKSDDELGQWALELMGSYNYRPEQWIDYLANIDTMGRRENLAFYELLTGYDRLPDMTWKGTDRFLRYTFTSPSTYLGIGTLGAGLLFRQAFKEAGKTGVKAYIKSMLPAMTAAAIEGGAYTGFDNLMRQEAEIDAARSNPAVAAQLGLKTETDIGEVALNTAAGVVADSVLAAGIPAAGTAAVKAVQAGSRKLDNMIDPSAFNMGVRTNWRKNGAG